MIIKVCGMTDQQNLNELLGLQPDWFGMIFYPHSKRFMENTSPKSDQNVKRIGVFVNATENKILTTAKDYNLDGIQLHGEEDPLLCARLKQEDFMVIKAFSIDDDFDFTQTKKYQNHVDYFLFDTKGKMPGGNGISFNWELMDKYKGSTPFLLAGGIGSENIEQLKSFHHPQFVGVDINSRFEITPGLKNIEKIKSFKNELLG